MMMVGHEKKRKKKQFPILGTVSGFGRERQREKTSKRYKRFFPKI